MKNIARLLSVIVILCMLMTVSGFSLIAPAFPGIDEEDATEAEETTAENDDPLAMKPPVTDEPAPDVGEPVEDETPAESEEPAAEEEPAEEPDALPPVEDEPEAEATADEDPADEDDGENMNDGAVDSGWRIFGYGEEDYTAEYGLQYAGGEPAEDSVQTISGVIYGAVVDNAGAVYFGSARPAEEAESEEDAEDAMPAEDADEAEIADAAKGRGPIQEDASNAAATDIRGVFGFLMRGDVRDGVYVEDVTVTTEEATVLYIDGNGGFYFDNARLAPQNGVLFQMIDSDAETEENASCQVNATYSNGVYQGSIYNGTGSSGQPGDSLTVTLGENTLLNGEIALTNAVRAIPYSAQALEGIDYYGDEIEYVLLDANGEECDEDDAVSIAFVRYGESAGFLLGHVQNALSYNGASAVDVVVEDGGVWVVRGESLITGLTVEEGGTVYGSVAANPDGSLTLLPSAVALEAGSYAASAPEGTDETEDEAPADEAPVEDEEAPAEEEAPMDEDEAPAENEVSIKDRVFPEEEAPTEDAPRPEEEDAVADDDELAVQQTVIIGGETHTLSLYMVDGVGYARLADIAALLAPQSLI